MPPARYGGGQRGSVLYIIEDVVNAPVTALITGGTAAVFAAKANPSNTNAVLSVADSTFKISADGKISAKSSVNYDSGKTREENQYTITVVATVGSSVNCVVTIQVLNVNEKPQQLSTQTRLLKIDRIPLLPMRHNFTTLFGA